MPWQTIVNTINLLFFPGFNPGFIVVIISISRYNKHVIINSDFKLVTKHQKAFTIVELLVVIVVIAILAVISFVSYQGISRRAVAVSLQSDLSQASKQIKLYQVDHGFYPSGVETGTNCLKDSLGVVDASYCLKISDGNSLIYSLDTSTNPYGFSLISSNINNMNYIVTNDAAPAEYKVATSPTNLVATVNSATQITLTWSAPSSNGGTSITGYKIYRGIALGAETLLTTVTSALSSLCAGLTQMLPVAAMLMIILAGVIYAAGQMMGAETRARANVWATAALTGALIAILISVVAPSVLNTIYNPTNDPTKLIAC